MNDLLSFYTSLLKSIGCSILPDGSIVELSVDGDMVKPVMIEVDGISKKLMLPTSEVIKNGNWEEMVLFHPCCENVYRGQSEVIQLLTRLISTQVYSAVQLMVAALIYLCRDKEIKGKISRQAMEIIGKFDTVHNDARAFFLALAKKNTGIGGKAPLLYYRLARGGKVAGKAYDRTCVLHVPFLEKADAKVIDTSVDMKHVNVIRSIYAYVIPETVRYGSNSKTMPYLMALLEAYYGTVNHLNDIYRKLGKALTLVKSEVTIYEMDTSWYDALASLPGLYKKYMPQVFPGNNGILIDETDDSASPNTQVLPAPNANVPTSNASPNIFIPPPPTPDIPMAPQFHNSNTGMRPNPQQSMPTPAPNSSMMLPLENLISSVGNRPAPGYPQHQQPYQPPYQQPLHQQPMYPQQQYPTNVQPTIPARPSPSFNTQTGALAVPDIFRAI